MSKKTKRVATLTCDCGNPMGEARVSFKDGDPLTKSLTLGAQLLEENDRLTAQVRAVSDAHRDCWRTESELGYWKARRRRFFGAWHVTVKVDLTPWSWRWKPKLFRSSGAVELAWLFLAVEALEA